MGAPPPNNPAHIRNGIPYVFTVLGKPVNIPISFFLFLFHNYQGPCPLPQPHHRAVISVSQGTGSNACRGKTGNVRGRYSPGEKTYDLSK